MNPEWFTAGIAGVCAIATLVSAWTNVRVKLSLETFKGELRDWINGSFMRAREVESKFEAVEQRINQMEHHRAGR